MLSTADILKLNVPPAPVVEPSFVTFEELKAFEQVSKAQFAEMPKPEPIRSSKEMIEREKRRLAKRLLSRKYEALNLYEPLPLADQFHRCNAVWRLLSGSNRAGKSVAGYIEAARAFTGQDPYSKYPKQNGNALMVGLKLDHIAMMYRKMFFPGTFKLIKDEFTKMYRAVRFDPNDPTSLLPYDDAYREKWIDSPPLIPSRCVKNIAMEDTKKDVPRVITFKNGWHSIWLSALGTPEQGEHYNFVQFDEEMPNPEFYKEAHRGLTRTYETIDQRPKGIWSATAQVSNVELTEMRAKADADPQSDFVRSFNFLLENNPYFSPEARQEFAEGYSDEDQLTRVHGIPSAQVRQIYRTFNLDGNSEDGSGHGCDAFEIDPAKFTRYVFVDPSPRHCATILVAIDEEEKYMTIYDAFDITGATGRAWAYELRQRQNGHCYEAIICDQQMGKESLAARDRVTCASEYWASIEELGVQVRQKGEMCGFFPSCNNVDARTQTLQKAMEIRGNGPHEGTCRLRIMRGLDPNLRKQILRTQTDPNNPKKRYKNTKIPQDYTDVTEYASAHPMKYHTPEKIVEEKDKTAYDVFIERQKLLKRKQRLKSRRYVGYAVHSASPSN